jgi:diamine N-acetyltransferase
MTMVSLRPITRANFHECLRLELPPEQARHVASNVYSIAEAFVEPGWQPRGVYAGDELVGFAMYGQEDATGRWWIIRLMIASAHQNRGYGRAALHALVGEVIAQHEAAEIVISTGPDNALALALYRSFGFQDTGEIDEGELVLALDRGRYPQAGATYEQAGRG